MLPGDNVFPQPGQNRMQKDLENIDSQGYISAASRNYVKSAADLVITSIAHCNRSALEY